MGYTSLNPNSYIEYAGDIYGGFALTAIAGDQGLGDVVIPSNLKGQIYNAYYDFYIGTYYDTSGALNETDGAQTIQIAVNGDWLTPHNAIAVKDGALRVTANGVFHGGWLLGQYDIGAYIKAGDTVTGNWSNGKALGNVIGCNFIQPRLRIIMG